MIELYSNFLTDAESNELIEYYNVNFERVFYEQNKVYTFKGIDIVNYENLQIYNKVDLRGSSTLRVQLISEDVQPVDYFHKHSDPWTFLIFLNDDYEGGELEIENFVVKPKKNQLLVFSGSLGHRVKPVTKGNRYTFVAITDTKVKIHSNLI